MPAEIEALFLHKAGDFVSEIIFLLLQAFASLVDKEAGDADIAAKFLSGVVHVLLNGDGIVLNVGLLGETNLLVELVHLTHDHLLKDRLRLVGVLLVVLHERELDLLLFL